MENYIYETGAEQIDDLTMPATDLTNATAANLTFQVAYQLYSDPSEDFSDTLEVLVSNDCGSSWKVISPDMTTNDTTKQKQATSGGLTIDATKAENYTTITAIAPSPLDEDVVWVGTDDGNLWITKDAGDTWTKLNKKLNGFVEEGSWIPQIVPSNHNKGEAFIVVNDYRRNNWEPYLVKATDYGSKMSSLITEDVKGHCHSIVEDHIEPNLLFLGTEFGLYFSTNAGEKWTKWTHNYPSAPTIDLKIHPRESDLIIGTFGRAAYILDDIDPLRELAATQEKSLENDFQVFETRPYTQFSYSRGPGSRFGADTEFKGQNGRGGASISYYLKPGIKIEEKKEGKKKQTDKKNIHVHVLNVKGDTIRSFKRDAENGFSTLNWYGEQNGVRFPGRKKPKKDAYPPSGREVFPGTYKVILVYRGFKDSTSVEVKPDPRRPFVASAVQSRNATYDDFMSHVESATEAFDLLNQFSDEINHVNTRTGNMVDSLATKVKDKGKELKKEIARLKELYTTPEGFEGYDDVTVRLNGQIWATVDYISSSDGLPGENAITSKNKTEKAIAEVVGEINHFIENEWKAYQELVKSLDFPIFKEAETIQLK